MRARDEHTSHQPGGPDPLRADRIIVDCLGRLHYPLPGSVPYLVGLLRAGDRRLAQDILDYLRTWRMTEAIPHLRSVLRLEPPASVLRQDVGDVLRSLGARRTTA